MTSCLHGYQLMMKSLRKLPGLGRSIGVTGTITASNAEQSNTFTQSIPVVNQSSSQRLPPGYAPGLIFKEIRSASNWSQMRLQISPIPAKWLGNKFIFTKQKMNALLPFKFSSKDSDKNIPYQFIN